MTTPDVTALVLAYQAGDRRAGEQLLALHEPLVAAIVRRRSRMMRDLSFADDLAQEGRIGLLRAAEKWAPGKASFRTYAGIWIDAKVGIYASQRFGVVTRTISDLQREPTTRYGAKRAPVSLDAPVGEDGTAMRLDFLRAHGASPEDVVIAALDVRAAHATITRAVAQLKPREREVVRLRFVGEAPASQSVTAARIGLTQARIGQIEAKAVGKLARALRCDVETMRAQLVGIAQVERRAA